jgi:KDO2-lipid IV(A) lauroyltransferase
MYYVVYGLLYLLSLIPFWWMYRLSDLLVILFYHLTGYRKKVVMDNLRHAFPEKTEKELKSICRAFYRNFMDTWLEMLKILSISKKTALKRISHNYEVIEELYKTGKSIQAYGGHFMNWEYVTISLPPNQPYTVLAVYMPISNAIMERLLLKLRSRFGIVMLKAGNMKIEMEAWKDRQYLLALGADQSPGHPESAVWLSYMNRPTGFVKSPWKQACLLNHPTIFYTITRKKRGYYHFEAELFEAEPARFTEAEMAQKYARRMEEEIKRTPDNYLWTHRRWKHEWKPEYAALWVDEKPMPQ